MVIKNLRNGIMVKVIHCLECYKIAEINSDNETAIFDEPKYCPFCGTYCGSDHGPIDEQQDEDYYDEYH